MPVELVPLRIKEKIMKRLPRDNKSFSNREEVRTLGEYSLSKISQQETKSILNRKVHFGYLRLASKGSYSSEP